MESYLNFFTAFKLFIIVLQWDLKLQYLLRFSFDNSRLMGI